MMINLQTTFTGVHPAGSEKKTMQIHFRQNIAPLATVMMMVGVAVFSGCEKKPEVYTSRADDPAYKKMLEQTRANQAKLANVRSRVVAQVEDFITRAREALPPNATDEQVLAELDGNPKKYPGWKPMKEALAKSEENIKGEMSKAQQIVRERILKEAADRKAVAKGQAVGKSATK